MLHRPSISIRLILLAGLCAGRSAASTGQALSARQRAAVTDTIRLQADRVVAAIASRNIDRFMELFTTEADLTYVDNGRIYPSRAALASAAGGFFKRIGSAGGTWDSPRILPLSSSAGAFTGIFRPQMVDTAGQPLWTDGKIWTLVYERRNGAWVIVQAHEVNARPAR